ncbi:MAG: Hsp20/alpha crystallin family protein [Candidatus Paceibacteria bacterium]
MPRRKKEISPSLLPELEEGELTVDVYQTPEHIVVQTAVAGVKPEDLDIAITEDTVTIRGRREREEMVPDEDFFCKECFWGPFSRRIVLPNRVDANAAQAVMKNNGILTIRLPKLNKSRTKQVKIEEV